MAVRTCRVTGRNSQGVERVVEVTAQSLYEAVAQALRVFREDDWSEDPNRVPASVVVAIKNPEVEHRVRIKDFRKLARCSWQESGGNGAEEPLAGYFRTLARARRTSTVIF